MSNLQIGLAIAGGVVLAAIVAHGAWNARKNAPRQAQPEPSDSAQAAPLREPSLDANALGDAQAMTLPPAARRSAMDSLIDVIATIALDGPNTQVSGEAAIAAMPATRRAGTKPFAIEGYNLATLTWEVPSPGQRYGGFQAGVQLANRSGALNEIEYSEYVVKTQAFADAINATPEFPEMLEEVARARELDQLPAPTMPSWALRSARATHPGAPAMCIRMPHGWALWRASFRGAWCCQRAWKAWHRSWC